MGVSGYTWVELSKKMFHVEQMGYKNSQYVKYVCLHIHGMSIPSIHQVELVDRGELICFNSKES